MGYDGTVKIGTELDSSGVKKGLDEINGTAQSGFSKFSEIGKNALSVFAGNMLTGVVSQAKNAAGAVLDIEALVDRARTNGEFVRIKLGKEVLSWQKKQSSSAAMKRSRRAA